MKRILPFLFLFVASTAGANDVRQRQYGCATTIDFQLWKTDGTELKVDAVSVGADDNVLLMKDEGNEAATTADGFTDEGQGYSTTLTAAEMQAARLVLYVVDTGTKVWLDKVVNIETYGSGLTDGTAQAGAAGTITLASTASATDDFYNGAVVSITGGTGQGESALITDYVGSTKVATIYFLGAGSTGNWATNPANTSCYTIVPDAPKVTKTMLTDSIAAASIATGAITNAKFASGAIDAAAIATDAIGAAEIAADAIGSSEIATGAIDTTALAAGAITTSSLAAGAIHTTAIAANAITATTIAADAITAAKIANDAIGATEIANAAIDAATFTAGAIDAAAIATDAIGAAEIANGALDAATVTGALPANLTQIDAQATNGYNATLNLKSLDIQNSTGSALITKSSSNGKYGWECGSTGTGNSHCAYLASTNGAAIATAGGTYGLSLGGTTAGLDMNSLSTNAKTAVAASVWDEALAGHATAGTAGKTLSTAGTAGDPWATALPGAYGAGTAGKILGSGVGTSGPRVD